MATPSLLSPLARLFVIGAAAAVTAATLPAATSILVSENFDSMRLNDDDLDREDLAAAGWYSWAANTSGAYAGIVVAPSGMSGRVLNVGGSSANSYHHTQWNDVSLSNVGDSITLTLDARAASIGNNTNPFEFAFLDSSTVITEHSKGGTDPMSTASGFSYRINSTGEAFLAYTNGTATSIASDATYPSIFGSVVNSFSFSVTITSADTANLRLMVNGVESLSFNQSFSGSIDFNTLRIRSSTGAQWDNINVIHVAAIPEPASVAALAGLATLGLAAARRRRS